jgi:hypothetical protein
MIPAFALVYKPAMQIRDLASVRTQNEPYVLARTTATPNTYIAVAAGWRAWQPRQGFEVIAFDGA